LQANDYPAARQVWQRIRPFEQLRADGESENNVSVVKEALAQLDLCRRDVRPPCRVLDEAGRAAVTRMLTEWGMLGV
jgi:4-hydroxy-tetrahydrodipicolinate synthase